jgi:hypothetical protein
MFHKAKKGLIKEEDNLTHIISAAEKAIEFYCGTVTHDTRKKKGMFYSLLVNLSNLEPLTKAIIVYTLLFIQGGKKLNHLIISNVPKSVFDSLNITNPKLILKKHDVFINMMTSVYKCDEDIIKQSAKEIFELTNRKDIQYYLANSIKCGKGTESYFAPVAAQEKLLIVLKIEIENIQSRFLIQEKKRYSIG